MPEKCSQCGRTDMQIVNECGCDPNNLPTRPKYMVGDADGYIVLHGSWLRRKGPGRLFLRPWDQVAPYVNRNRHGSILTFRVSGHVTNVSDGTRCYYHEDLTGPDGVSVMLFIGPGVTKELEQGARAAMRHHTDVVRFIRCVITEWLEGE